MHEQRWDLGTKNESSVAPGRPQLSDTRIWRETQKRPHPARCRPFCKRGALSTHILPRSPQCTMQVTWGLLWCQERWELRACPPPAPPNRTSLISALSSASPTRSPGRWVIFQFEDFLGSSLHEPPQQEALVTENCAEGPREPQCRWRTRTSGASPDTVVTPQPRTQAWPALSPTEQSGSSILLESMLPRTP